VTPKFNLGELVLFDQGEVAVEAGRSRMVTAAILQVHTTAPCPSYTILYSEFWGHSPATATVRESKLSAITKEEKMNEKSCCSDCEELVGPLATDSDIPVMMEKLEAAWHDLQALWEFSLADTLGLILPARLGDVDFTDAEFNTALDELLATWADDE